MPFVVDASVTAAWLMPDEQNELAEHVFEMLIDDTAIVPAIWWFETRNLLIINERRNRIAVERREGLLTLLSELPVQLDRAPDEVRIMALARQHSLTVYDAAYLELAARMDIPLATLDRRLEAAATAEKIALFSR